MTLPDVLLTVALLNLAAVCVAIVILCRTPFCAVCNTRPSWDARVEKSYRDALLAQSSEIVDRRAECAHLRALLAEGLKPGILHAVTPKPPRPEVVHEPPPAMEML